MTDAELVDIKAKYTECCGALRHYSLCVLNTRTITIAQGLFLLGGAGYLTKENNFLLSSSVSFFGLFFTYVLKKLQENYWLHCNSFLETVKKLEGEAGGPWSTYEEQKTKRHKELQWRYLVINGPFNLLLVAFLFILGFNAYNSRQIVLFVIFIGILVVGSLILGLYKFWRSKTGRMSRHAT